MESVGKLLLGLGLAIAAVGAALLVLSRLGLHRLPGDVVIRRGNFVFYSPLGLSLLLSALLTLALSILARK